LQEQYITIFLALNEMVKSPIAISTTNEFATRDETIATDKPANHGVLREEFQVREIYIGAHICKLAVT
jgi:hypothetical protein